MQSEAAERRRLLIRLKEMKPKLQLSEVLEGGNLVLGLVHRPCNSKRDRRSDRVLAINIMVPHPRPSGIIPSSVVSMAFMTFMKPVGLVLVFTVANNK